MSSPNGNNRRNLARSSIPQRKPRNTRTNKYPSRLREDEVATLHGLETHQANGTIPQNVRNDRYYENIGNGGEIGAQIESLMYALNIGTKGYEFAHDPHTRNCSIKVHNTNKDAPIPTRWQNLNEELKKTKNEMLRVRSISYESSDGEVTVSAERVFEFLKERLDLQITENIEISWGDDSIAGKVRLFYNQLAKEIGSDSRLSKYNVTQGNNVHKQWAGDSSDELNGNGGLHR